MNTELRKRLEEAAVQDCKDYGNGVVNGRDVTAFIHGGEWMFKECGGMTVLHDMRKLILAQCNDAIVDIANERFGDFEQSVKLAERVTDRLKKLWEEKK